MQELSFKLFICATELEKYYSGAAKHVFVSADNGRSLQFPLSAIQKFVTTDGVSGRFVIRFDDNNSLVDVSRIST